MLALAIPFPAGDRLDHEYIHSRKAKWYSVAVMVFKTNAVATGDHLCTDWTEHPQGEDKGPESECGQQSPHQVGRAGPGRSK